MKININRSEHLQLALYAAQHGARVRTASAADIEALVDRIEIVLEGLMYKKDWIGLRFLLDPNGQQFPNAYNGAPQSTQIEVERYRTGWFVTQVTRRYCQAHEVQSMNIIHYGEQLATHAASPAVWS